MKKNYEEEAIKLSKAINIAIESFQKYPRKDWTKEIHEQTISIYYELQKATLNPNPEFKKITSLKYLINDVFTYFQESYGNDVEYFWQQIDSQNLDFVRENKIDKILTRGKIKNRIEFEYITDIIVAIEQEKKITQIQAEKLKQFIGEFESKNKNNKNVV